MDKINLLRNDINTCDNEIIKLLEKRFKLCKQIGNIKSKNNINVVRKNREENILDRLYNLTNLSDDLILNYGLKSLIIQRISKIIFLYIYICLVIFL